MPELATLVPTSTSSEQLTFSMTMFGSQRCALIGNNAQNQDVIHGVEIDIMTPGKVQAYRTRGRKTLGAKSKGWVLFVADSDNTSDVELLKQVQTTFVSKIILVVLGDHRDGKREVDKWSAVVQNSDRLSIHYFERCATSKEDIIKEVYGDCHHLDMEQQLLKLGMSW